MYHYRIERAFFSEKTFGSDKKSGASRGSMLNLPENKINSVKFEIDLQYDLLTITIKNNK